MPNQQRIESIDWLRGLMATGIMIYHYFSSISYYDAGTILGKLGVYGVSIFYILSGLSLSITYYDYFNNLESVKTFVIRRIFRILPLIAAVTTINLLLRLVAGVTIPSLTVIILNYTALFSFVNPTAYIAAGAWSIGCEMVFYIMFPIFIAAYSKSNKYGNLLFILTIVIAMFYAFFILESTLPLSTQWAQYITPLNQLYLFVAGITMFYMFRDVDSATFSKHPSFFIILILLIGIGIYPTTGDAILIVSGFNRVLFSLASIGLVVLIWKSRIAFPMIVKRVLNTMGMISYSIYLLHPIILLAYKKFLSQYFDSSLLIALSSITTFITGYLVYKYFEEPFILMGKKLTNRRITSIGVVDI